MKIDKIKFTAFVHKMSCLEYSYFLIKNGYNNIDLGPEQDDEIKSIINKSLHRRLILLSRKSINSGTIKLSNEAQLIYDMLKKYEHLIDI